MALVVTRKKILEGGIIIAQTAIKVALKK